ncbi:hypothetical protein Golomagni_06081, partial [Golovinomyces magnicellulatus]
MNGGSTAHEADLAERSSAAMSVSPTCPTRCTERACVRASTLLPWSSASPVWASRHSSTPSSTPPSTRARRCRPRTRSAPRPSPSSPSARVSATLHIGIQRIVTDSSLPCIPHRHRGERCSLETHRRRHTWFRRLYQQRPELEADRGQHRIALRQLPRAGEPREPQQAPRQPRPRLHLLCAAHRPQPATHRHRVHATLAPEGQPHPRHCQVRHAHRRRDRRVQAEDPQRHCTPPDRDLPRAHLRERGRGDHARNPGDLDQGALCCRRIQHRDRHARRPPRAWPRVPVGCDRGGQRGALRLCQAAPDAHPHAHGGAQGAHQQRAVRKVPQREARRHGRHTRPLGVQGGQPGSQDGRGACHPRGEVAEDGERDEARLPAKGGREGGQAQAERGGALRAPPRDARCAREAKAGARRQAPQARERPSAHARKGLAGHQEEGLLAPQLDRRSCQILAFSPGREFRVGAVLKLARPPRRGTLSVLLPSAL